MVEQHVRDFWTGEDDRWRTQLMLQGARRRMQTASENPMSLSFVGVILIGVATSFIGSYALFSLI